MWLQGRARDPASVNGASVRPLHEYLPGQTLLVRLIPNWPGTRAVVPYVIGLSGIAGVTLFLLPFRGQIHTTAFALIYLVLVLHVALAWGMSAAIVASLAGALAFDYFILPPTNAFNLNNTEDWSALLAFLVTSVTAGKLSVRARRAAVEVEARQMEKLQKQATELREQAQLLDLAHDAIMVRYLDGRIMFWNLGAAERYGWSKQDVVGGVRTSYSRPSFRSPWKRSWPRFSARAFGRANSSIAVGTVSALWWPVGGYYGETMTANPKPLWKSITTLRSASVPRNRSARLTRNLSSAYWNEPVT